MSWIVGVDACRGGWVAAFREIASGLVRVRVERSFAAILVAEEEPCIVAVDIPIGLAAAAVPGGRDCDRGARGLLGKTRSSSVFSAPVRTVLRASTYDEANAAQRHSSDHGIGLSQQAWGIVPKIAEVDVCLSPPVQDRVIEVHPELCFFELAGGSPMKVRKGDSAGLTERARLLRGAGFDVDRLLRDGLRGAKPDDILDAFVALWTAERFRTGTAIGIPALPARDETGLRMQIWR
jgi:predicted RNase H-like nuclease